MTAGEATGRPGARSAAASDSLHRNVNPVSLPRNIFAHFFTLHFVICVMVSFSHARRTVLSCGRFWDLSFWVYLF